MKAIVADNLTKMFGHLVAVDNVSFEQALTSSQGWKLIKGARKANGNNEDLSVDDDYGGDTFSSNEPRAEDNYEVLSLVAFSLPCRLYIAPIIRSGDVEYQAYHGVHHS